MYAFAFILDIIFLFLHSNKRKIYDINALNLKKTFIISIKEKGELHSSLKSHFRASEKRSRARSFITRRNDSLDPFFCYLS